MMSAPPRSSLYCTPAWSSLSVICATLSSGTPVNAGTYVGALAHCASTKMSPAAARPTMTMSARRGPPKRSSIVATESGMSALHVDHGPVRLGELVAQFDQHVDRQPRFFSCRHHLVQFH